MLFFPTVDEDVQYFRSQGYTGSINDMHFKAMGDLGYTGSLNDRIHAYLTFKYGSYYEAMRDLRNGTSVFALSAYIVNNLDPALVLDFGANYFRKSGSKSTLSDTVTHSRASNATMTDSDGVLKWAPHNLLRYSEDFSNAAWNEGTGLNSPEDQGDGVFKLSCKSGTGQHYFFQDLGDHILRHEIEVKASGSSFVSLGSTGTVDGVYFDLSLGVVGTESGGSTGTITALADGWFLVGVVFSGVERYITMTVASADAQASNYSADATESILVRRPRSVNSMSPMVNNPETGDSYVPTTSAAVYLPRVGHHIYDGYEWVNEGILHESEARTNLVTYSEQFDNAAWSKVNSSLSANVTTAPDGTTTADKLIADTSLVQHRLDQTPTSVAGDQTFSVYVKDAGYGFTWLRIGTSGARFSIADGTITSLSGGVTASSQDVGNGWRFMSISRSASANDIVRINALTTQDGSDFVGDGTSGILIWGAQLEAGSTPSSYIPTTTATVTRAAETLVVAAANMPDYMTPTYIGPELITNGTFDSDISGWTTYLGESTSTIDSGRLKVTNTGTYGSEYYQISGLKPFSNLRVYVEAIAGTSPSKAILRDSLNAGLGSDIVVNTSGYLNAAVPSDGIVRLFCFAQSPTVGAYAFYDNISVKEINPLSVSIQMQGKITYADGGSFTDGVFFDWTDGTDFITYRAGGYTTDSGKATFIQREAGVQDVVLSSNGVIAEGVFSPFNLSSRHGSTFINGAVDGTALTANTTPTVIPDLSANDFQIGPVFNGTISKLRVWGEDISDTGIATASAPTFTDEFAMTVTTTTANETFTIPCRNEGTFNAGIQWGDGSVSTVTAYNDADLTHTFATAGDHLIRIRGSFPNIYFNNAGDKLKVKSVDNLGIVGWTRLNKAFYGCSNMTSFTAGTTDTSAVTTMVSMFYGCSSITALDLSSFNTAAVTGMTEMFFGCTNLAALDLSSFNTTAVTNMNNVFRLCSSLTALDVSNFNTAAVTNIGGMFRDCSSLTALDVSNFNTTAVTNIGGMFRGCSSITALDLSSFNTTAVKTMGSMFCSCSGLTSLDVSNFNTTAATNISYMFFGCSSLTSLDVSSFNTAAVTTMSQMFRDCSSLTDIIGVEDFNIEGLNSTGDLTHFMLNVTLPTARYDALLINWDAQEPFDAMTPNFGNSTYTGGGTAAAARANLISNDLWVITDGGIA